MIEGRFTIPNPAEPSLIEIVVGERGLGARMNANTVGERGGFQV
jgi:hypothetical protein